MPVQDPTATTPVLPLDRWSSQLPALRARYHAARPFPHLVLDDFLSPAVARAARAEFPDPGAGPWIHYAHVNEDKLGRTDLAHFRPTLRALIEALNGPAFVAFLAELTGLRDLLWDPALEGGGLHQTLPGGFLNVHADFTVHPRHRAWRRRLNVLVYLNRDDWDESWGGHLELWDAAVTRCEARLLPRFNRLVVFATDETSFHGHPTPLACPPDTARRSVALYYYTRAEHAPPPRVRSTEYRARPGDAAVRAGLIWADKLALRVYDRVKRRLGLDDRHVSALLAWLARGRR